MDRHAELGDELRRLSAAEHEKRARGRAVLGLRMKLKLLASTG